MGFMAKSGFCDIASVKPQVTTVDQLCGIGWYGSSVSILELIKLQLNQLNKPSDAMRFE